MMNKPYTILIACLILLLLICEKVQSKSKDSRLKEKGLESESVHSPAKDKLRRKKEKIHGGLKKGNEHDITVPGLDPLSKPTFGSETSSSNRKNKRSSSNRKKSIPRNQLNQYLFNGLNLNFYKPESYKTLIPTYFVDPYILYLTNQRLQRCSIPPTQPYKPYTFKDINDLHYDNKTQKFQFNPNYFMRNGHSIPFQKSNIIHFAIKELQFLYETNALEYFRGHELLAYHYFIEYIHQNPHYQSNYMQAEMEYLPILPLHWRAVQLDQCSYSSFIEYLLLIQSYLEQRDLYITSSSLLRSSTNQSFSNLRQTSSSLATKFIIASTYNMRTMWGYGMPSQQRKGPIYQSMTNFVQNISVGHYERWPQCPDLLRKWWKYVIELPYLPIVGRLYNFEEIILREYNSVSGTNTMNSNSNNMMMSTVNLNIETMNLMNPINTFSKYYNLLKQREDTLLYSINQGIFGQRERQGIRRERRKLVTTDDEILGKGGFMNLMNAPNENVLQALHGLEGSDSSNNKNTNTAPIDGSSSNSGSSGSQTTTTNTENRKYTFLFIGNLEMVGPNKVCSVRSVLQSLLPRSDLLLIHIPLTSPMPGNELIDDEEVLKSYKYWQKSTNNQNDNSNQARGVYSQFVNYMEQSIFCIITGSTSYSTSFFYHAIENDCIPIVINDWFVFAFPWIISYETFVIRILEQDFIKSPNDVLNSIKEKYLPPVATAADTPEFSSSASLEGGQQPTGENNEQPGESSSSYYLLINNMRKAMLKMKLFLSYETITYQSNRYYKLLFSDIHYYYHYHYNPSIVVNDRDGQGQGGDGEEGNNNNDMSKRKDEKLQTMIPMELLLLELRYAQHPHKYYNNIPCTRPMLCSHKYSKHYYHTDPAYTSTPSAASGPTSNRRRRLKDETKGKRNQQGRKGEKLITSQEKKIQQGFIYSYQHYRSSSATSIPPASKGNKRANNNNLLIKLFSNQMLEKIIQSRYSLLFSKAIIFHSSDSSSSSSSSSVSYSYNLTTLNSNPNTTTSPLLEAVTLHQDYYQAHALFFDFLWKNPSVSQKFDYRPYLCKHTPRLIGQYKIVYFMQCVRVLWTLNPGKFKPYDLTQLSSLTDEKNQQPNSFEETIPSFYRDHNPYHLSANTIVQQNTVPVVEVKGTNGLTVFERDYILAFHNLSRPKGWKSINYPKNTDLSHILTYQQIAELDLMRGMMN